jgi:flagellar protein FliL
MALKAKAVQAEAKEAEAAGETADPAEGEAQAKSRKFSLKLIAMAAAGGVVVLGGGTAAYLMLGGGAHPAAAEAKPAVFLDVPEVLVNLSNAGSDHTQYLKIKLVLELPDPALMQQIQPVMPRIMDAFQTYLRELRPTDLDGSAGLYRLKEELTRRVNTAIAPRKVNGVLFKEIVVQ